MDNNEGQAGIPAWPNLPRDRDEFPAEPVRLSVPNKYTAFFALVWSLALFWVVLPFDLGDRNPPPFNLVPTWWFYFGLCLGLLVYNLGILYIPWKQWQREGRLGLRIIHLSTSGWAILVGVLLFHWVYEYPYLFDFFK